MKMEVEMTIDVVMEVLLNNICFPGESSSTAGTQEQILELGSRIDHISEKMLPKPQTIINPNHLLGMILRPIRRTT